MRMHFLKRGHAPPRSGSDPRRSSASAATAARRTGRRAWLVLLLLLVHEGCAGPRIRHVDDRNGVCVLDDGTQARYVAPAVKHSGAVPRIPREPPASGATRGVYDCLISAGA